ncbi:MAG: hypothetical protein V1745_03935 [Patescibacteria group bacterium]
MEHSSFTLKQIAHLREVEKKRLQKGMLGLRRDLQDLIRCSDPAYDPFDRIRHDQAKVLWDKGFGRALGFGSFKSYLASIPEIPQDLRADSEHFPILVLVDGRLDLMVIRHLVDIRIRGENVVFRPFDPKKVKTGVRFMRCQHGSGHLNQTIRFYRDSFLENEVGLDIVEGISLYVQYPEIVRYRDRYLANAVSVETPECTAFLGRVFIKVFIGESFDHVPRPHLGCPSRRV